MEEAGGRIQLEACVMVALMKLINRALKGSSTPSKAEKEDYVRSTSPDARMNLLLRFETANGPRTIMAPGVSLATASEIAFVMSRAGHFAEFVDWLPAMPLEERIKRRKAEARKSEVISLKWARHTGRYSQASGRCELH
jgi:hypothetical protein